MDSAFLCHARFITGHQCGSNLVKRNLVAVNLVVTTKSITTGVAGDRSILVEGEPGPELATVGAGDAAGPKEVKFQEPTREADLFPAVQAVIVRVNIKRVSKYFFTIFLLICVLFNDEHHQERFLFC